MKKLNCLKVLAAAAASVLMTGNLSAFGTVAESQSATLNIAKIEVLPEAVPEDRIISVDVRIADNDAGFLAAEFGIIYDDRLILEDVVRETSPGNAFEYTENPEGHFAWFSAASKDAASTACAGRQVLFTLKFLLPENYAEGDTYYIEYSWEGHALNARQRSSAYWYKDKSDNEIEWMRTHSISGSIKLPDPDAPTLTYTEVQMNRHETAAIGLLNYDGVAIWYTEHPEIAVFEDPTVGEITAVSPGTCTAYCLAGSTLLMCDITVTDEYFYNINSASVINISDSSAVVYITYPNPEGSVVWMTTRPDIVSVSNNGLLTFLKNGECQIIGTSNGLTYARPIVVDIPDEVETTEPPTETTTEEEPVITNVGPSGATDVPGQNNILPGDVDLSGKVDLLDVITLNKNLMIGTPLSVDALIAADALEDGVINATDSLTILKYVVRLIDTLPVAK